MMATSGLFVFQPSFGCSLRGHAGYVEPACHQSIHHGRSDQILVSGSCQGRPHTGLPRFECFLRAQQNTCRLVP